MFFVALLSSPIWFSNVLVLNGNQATAYRTVLAVPVHRKWCHAGATFRNTSGNYDDWSSDGGWFERTFYRSVGCGRDDEESVGCYRPAALAARLNEEVQRLRGLPPATLVYSSRLAQIVAHANGDRDSKSGGASPPDRKADR